MATNARRHSHNRTGAFHVALAAMIVVGACADPQQMIAPTCETDPSLCPEPEADTTANRCPLEESRRRNRP